MKDEMKQLVRVHKASRLLNSQVRCKDCGVVLVDRTRPHIQPSKHGDFYPENMEDKDVEFVDGILIVHDHNKNPYAVRCNQDFAPPDLADEVHGSADDPDQMSRLKTMFSNLVDKLEEDRKKDLAGIYRYSVSISVAKYKRDPAGWKRLW
jgi:hypothetical protein